MPSSDTYFKKGGNHIDYKAMLGKRHSQETREKIRSSLIGYKHSRETKEKLSKIKKGHIVSEETRKKISLTQKGRKLTNKQRDKLRIAHLISNKARAQNHYNWKGGISFNPYPAGFNRELKLKIRGRDNFICSLCGRTEKEELEELNRGLCVNHIDFDKSNCEENNLNTLCVRCNSKINHERGYWTNYFNTKLKCLTI